MKGNARNYSGSESRNYSKTKEYDAIHNVFLSGTALALGGVTVAALGNKLDNEALVYSGLGMSGAGASAIIGSTGYALHKDRSKDER